MWVVLGVLLFLILGFLPFLLFCGDAIADWIEAKAEEIRARAEKLRQENEERK